MTPKTAFQKECDELVLPDVDFDYFIKDKDFKHHFFFNNYKITCGCCAAVIDYDGKQFVNLDAHLENEDSLQFFRCPKCGRAMTIISNRQQKYHTRKYFIEKIDVVKNIQVSRIFEIEFKYQKNQRFNYDIKERMRYFFRDDDVALFSIPLVYTQSQWVFSKERTNFECLDKRTYSYDLVFSSKIHDVHPDFKLLPQFKYIRAKDVYAFLYQRRGYLDINYTLCDLINAYKINPKIFETIIQDERFHLVGRDEEYSLIECVLNGFNRNELIKHFDSIRIALNHNYDINELSLYLDYLEDLDYLNKDLRNPKYICPSNLISEHNKTSRKVSAIQKKIAAEEKLKDALKFAEKYLKAVKKYLGIDIGDKEITISILPDIEAFKIEGEILNHCVFTREYYKKITQDILILSAKSRIDMKNLETVEFDLKRGVVLQSRGYNNKPSSEHDHILKLVKKNYQLLRQSPDLSSMA